MTQKYLFILFAAAFFVSCSSTETEETNDAQNITSEIDTTKNEGLTEEKLIDMYPAITFDDAYYNEEVYLEPSMLCFNGKIGKEKIEMIFFSEPTSISGRYVYSEKPLANFEIDGNYFQKNDSIYCVRKKDGVISEEFLARSTNGTSFSGIWIKNQDTLNLSLELIEATLVQQQFLVNNTSAVNLINTKTGMLAVQNNFITHFNSFQAFEQEDEGFDTGEASYIDYSAVFYRDSIIVLVEAGINNEISDNYVEGHEYDSEDPITDGQSISADVDIRIKIIEKGKATEKEISFLNELDNLSLHIFKNQLIFSELNSDKSTVYKWSDKEQSNISLSTDCSQL